MDKKPLFIPKTKRISGLKVYCYECGTTVDEICKKSGKPITQCKHGDKHIYKAFAHIPGTKNGRKTLNLETLDYDEAQKETIKFRANVKSPDYQERKKTKEIAEKQKPVEIDNRPYLLIHALARYVGWLNGEGVPAHERRFRSPDHIKDVERALKVLVECWKKSKYNLGTLEVDQINKDMVGKVFEYLLEEKKYSARTFNKVIGYYTSFVSWYSEEYNILLRNYFEKVKRKPLNPKPQSITYKEFTALLQKVTPENGVKEYQNGVKPERNLYRNWLVQGFRLALESGRRREEVINMRWNDIKESEGIQYIVIEDFKVNRIQNRMRPEEKKFVYVPMTKSLLQLLQEMGFEKYRGTNNFILAPEEKISRKKFMSDVLSRGFSHFYKQLNTGKALTFKSLRKTYITKLEIFMGHGNTKEITGHSDDAVIDNNYLDKVELVKTARNFQPFHNEEERENDLREIRKITHPSSKQLNK